MARISAGADGPVADRTKRRARRHVPSDSRWLADACGDADVALRVVAADTADRHTSVVEAMKQGKRDGAVVLITGVEDDVLHARPAWLSAALDAIPSTALDAGLPFGHRIALIRDTAVGDGSPARSLGIPVISFDTPEIAVASALSRLRLAAEGEGRVHEVEESMSASQATHRLRLRVDLALRAVLAPNKEEVRDMYLLPAARSRENNGMKYESTQHSDASASTLARAHSYACAHARTCKTHTHMRRRVRRETQ